MEILIREEQRSTSTGFQPPLQSPSQCTNQQNQIKANACPLLCGGFREATMTHGLLSAAPTGPTTMEIAETEIFAQATTQAMQALDAGIRSAKMKMISLPTFLCVIEIIMHAQQECRKMLM